MTYSKMDLNHKPFPSKTQKLDVCNSENLKSYMQILAQNFNALDLPQIDQDPNFTDEESSKRIFMQLVSSTYALIQHHQRNITIAKESNLEKNMLMNDIKTLKTENQKLNFELAKHKDKGKILEENIKKLNLSRDTERKLVLKSENELKSMKKVFHTKEKLLHAQIQHETDKNNKLNERIRKNCGKYISVDECLVNTLKEYQENEKSMKITIQKLQENNENLIKELINLKQDIIELHQQIDKK